jgi:hypothetical protein
MQEINFRNLDIPTPYKDTPEGKEQEKAKDDFGPQYSRFFKFEEEDLIEPAIDYTSQYLAELALRNCE